ncbi:MAG: hypothetical protein GXO30_00630, partial [Epsilonproteobacteria bacterium]|nr:hypothetical protein [Campylobacterota bacterium]
MYRVKLFMIVFMCIISLKLTASNIDFSKNSENILLDSEIYIDKENLTLQQLKNDVNFLKSNTSYINLGFVRDTTVWVKLCFYNNTNKKLTKILEIRNPLLQSVFLYGNKEVKKKGTLYLDNKKKRYINTIFKLSLDSKE